MATVFLHYHAFFCKSNMQGVFFMKDVFSLEVQCTTRNYTDVFIHKFRLMLSGSNRHGVIVINYSFLSNRLN